MASVLADLQLARERGTQEAVDVEFQGFPTFSATLSALAGIDAGTRNGRNLFVILILFLLEMFS